MSFIAALPIVGKVLGKVMDVIDQAVEDKDQAALLRQQVQVKMLEGEFGFIEAEIRDRAAIITAEAQGVSWLQRNWRPILMLTFTYVVAHNHIISPLLSLPRLDVPSEMWELLKLGMGGYIIGRSVEKSIEAWKAGGVSTVSGKKVGG